MFTTITYNRDTPDGIRVQQASAQNFGGRRPARLACIECRAKKVKCTGERDGCTKCRACGVRCEYPQSSDRGIAGRRRATTATTTTTATSAPTSQSSLEKASAKNKADQGNASPSAPVLPASCDFDLDLASLPVSMGLGTSDPSPPSPAHSLELDPMLEYMSPRSLDTSGQGFLLCAGQMDEHFMCEMDKGLEKLLSSALSPSDNASLTSLSNSEFATSPGTSDSPHIGLMSGPSSFRHEIPSSNSCFCSKSAIHLLEELQSKDYSDVHLTVDVVLSYEKMALTQLQSWLSCSDCQTPKATAMVLALVVDRLSFYLEKSVAHSGMVRRGSKQPTTLYSRSVAIGSYQIESTHELMDVSRVLLLTLCKDLIRVLDMLKERGVTDGMLATSEKTVRKAIREVESWEESDPGK